MKRRTSLSWLLLVGFVACGPAGSPGPSQDIVEFTRGRYGGLCPTPDGAGAVCRLEVTVLDDATWRGTAVPPHEASGGAVREGAASELAAVFEEGWEALTERAFEGTCPVAYDGSEIFYRLRRVPRGPGAELADAVVLEVRSCTHDLDHPRARAVVDRIEELWGELGIPR